MDYNSVEAFIQRWSASHLREQQAAQSHFNELCALVNHPTPTQLDPAGTYFTFEEHVAKATGGRGRADVWYKGKFAWEYKGKAKDLDAAYHQVLAYKGALENPPLLVVCDFEHYRIYPQWTNMSDKPFEFKNEDLRDPAILRYISWLLTNPDEFKRLRLEEQEKRSDLTLELARKFGELAEKMRSLKDEGGNPVWKPMQIARFLTKLVFALFAEDIGLLPAIEGKPIFSYVVQNAERRQHLFVRYLTQLFEAMNGQTDEFVMQPIPYFNGGLFRDSTDGANDGIEVLDLSLLGFDKVLSTLTDVTKAEWQHINPTIFGTLFEGALDPGKRAQLGAHYTSEADIRLIVEPVLMEPLYREWHEIEAAAAPMLIEVQKPETSPNKRAELQEELIALHDKMMTRLGTITILDPACGSGNFLYVSLRALKDLESRVRRTFAPLGLPFRDVVTPRQLYGIERDEFAARLAHVVVWIGYLQWRYEQFGTLDVVHKTGDLKPNEIKSPVLNDKNEDGKERIVCDDAIMRYDTDGKPYEPEWPAVDVIMGNPPFLGTKKLRGELGKKYVTDLFALYKDRIPGFSDLVCYWFEIARERIEAQKANRAGLIATNSIRGGENRTVLDRINETGNIFLAYSDEPWLLQGAAVRISVVGFDSGVIPTHKLNGRNVAAINSDLTESNFDITKSKVLPENASIAFLGDVKGGSFDIPLHIADEMLKAQNKSGKSNRDVVKPTANALDITSRWRNYWIIDFGTDMSIDEARLYEKPFAYVESVVKPEREKGKPSRSEWWLHMRPGVSMRQALAPMQRYLVTPSVSKHRIYSWFKPNILSSHLLITFARDDDYFFGVLHSYLHETWSLRMGTWLGKGNDPRYTPTTTFETFPFPYTPGAEPTNDPHYVAISEAARCLNEERDAWLNPEGLGEAGLRQRTLTNLYNELVNYRQTVANSQVWMAVDHVPAQKFAPRLAQLHAALDSAVLAAYGWPDLESQLRTDEGDEEMLRRLLALNLERSGK